MADFKLSRFKYTWRGNWTVSTVYLRDDVVRYGGSSWVCRRKHTASIFATEQLYIAPGESVVTPTWIKMSDGYVWRNLWQVSTLYNPGDVVRYGGVLYLCAVSHTSSGTFDLDLPQWVIYSSQYNFRQEWSTNTRYAVGDVVRYGGIVYRCIAGHLSSGLISSGLEQHQNNWQSINEGVDYKGDWSEGVRYKKNDLVKFGGTLFRCKEGNIAGTDSTINFDQDEYWDIELPGWQYELDWDDNTVYQVGDVVRNGGYLYYCLVNNFNKRPILSSYQLEDQGDPAFWTVLSKGINFRGVWSSAEDYKTGDLVRRGGNLYECILDTDLSADGSTIDYLDTSNWKLVNISKNWRDEWHSGENYQINDLVVFKGSTYQCNLSHESADDNYPGDNGSGFVYWDLLIQSGPNVALEKKGDILTYDLSRTAAGDGSTFGPTPIPLSDQGQLITINNDSVIYKRYGEVSRLFWVDINGIDDVTDPQRGISPYKPWRTVRFACEQADDGYTGTTTIEVGPGVFQEVLPIIVPKKTAIVGSELRSTTIEPKPANENLALDSTYTKAVLDKFTLLLPSILNGVLVDPTEGNAVSQSVLYEQDGITKIVANQSAINHILTLITDIKNYINFYIESGGTDPVLTGSNTASTDAENIAARDILAANKEFLAAEAVAYMEAVFSSYEFVGDACKRDVRRYVEAWMYDIIYSGNYKSILAARYYRNAVLGSEIEDMFYFRDATGLRNMTIRGLEGTLNPPNVFDLYRIPTGKSFCSLDPGWGPDDQRVWITTRSPYIQGVTTFGTGCVGQKIDGSLHNGGYKSMVSNDFTQVLSDGVGAWVSNDGRAELVSVFTYYCHIGYYAKDGGKIRATNGNNSYGTFGAIADGVDLTETPRTGQVWNRDNDPSASAFAGDFTDTIQILEFDHGGENYTQASVSIVGAGGGAQAVFEEFRDDAVFQVRRLDANTTGVIQSIGGGGYTRVQNTAQNRTQPGTDTNSITLSSNDSADNAEYIGLRIIITGGPGTGQYGYITSYNSTTKLAQVSRETDDVAGWDHLIPGTPSVTEFTTSTAYRIEPRVIFSDPGFTATSNNLDITANWVSSIYGETYQTFTDVASSPGTGSVIGDDGLIPITATFDIVKVGRTYQVTINNDGAGYKTGDELVIDGTLLGGTSPLNDCNIKVTAVSEDSTNSIVSFTSSGFGISGNFVLISNNSATGLYSSDGSSWQNMTMPSIGDWNSIAWGDNKFVAIRKNSSAAASSRTGATWTARTMPASRLWSAVAYGNGRFVAVAEDQNSAAYSTNGETWTSATMPTAGDSTINQWVDITYGAQRFVAIANSSNVAAYSANGVTWTVSYIDVLSDSTQRDWTSVAFGNNRYVAISSQGDVAYSFNADVWMYGGSLNVVASGMIWKKIKYAQGVFVAVGETDSNTATTVAVTSTDGITWTLRDLVASARWNTIAFGNPYNDQRDSSVGKNSPLWIAAGLNSNASAVIRTGARAKGRVETTSGVISGIKLWDSGSGYLEDPTVTIIDPNNTGDAILVARIGDGVLTNPTWINRGLGYRSATTRITITGDGYADIYPVGKFVTLVNMEVYPSLGAQIIFSGNPTRYTVVTVESKTTTIDEEGFSAKIRISPELRVRDDISHLSTVSIRERFSQCRITGHDFLDIGTGNFEESNYPEIYSTGDYVPAPENEVIEEDGGRVFYTSTDQSGNFRTGELFAVEQATGIVTISADFFDLSGLTELRLGGIRVGGSGAVIREFSTDPLFTADSNNIVPTQRAVARYLANRLSLGGSEVEVGSIIAGQIQLGGPNTIGNTLTRKIVVPVLANFSGPDSAASGSMIAQGMFFRSFSDE